MRGLIVVACAVLMLAAAPAARADVTIGSALTKEPNGTVGPDSTVSLHVDPRP